MFPEAEYATKITMNFMKVWFYEDRFCDYDGNDETIFLWVKMCSENSNASLLFALVFCGSFCVQAHCAWKRRGKNKRGRPGDDKVNKVSQDNRRSFTNS